MPTKNQTTLEQIIRNLYSSVLTGVLLLASPTLILRPKTRAGLKQKLGFIEPNVYKKLAQSKQTIWIHAVSVGEFNAAYPLIEQIKAKFPDWSLIISTTTKTGQMMAKQRAGSIAQVIYFPFDLPWSVEHWLSLVNPLLVIIFETELWPNFICSCSQRQIPIMLLNARMSPRSYNGYKNIKWLFAPLIQKLTLIGAQTAREAEHYQALSDKELPIKVFGNLKYDWPALIDDQASKESKRNLGIDENDLVLIAGSTHADEEKTILNIYQTFIAKLKNSGDKTLRLIIAPRHPERFDEVAKIIEKARYTVKRHSKHENFSSLNDIYLLDSIGLLANFYAIASVAFVGGSLAKIGGHNLLEPYLYATPVVCGPHLHKTKETATILSNKNALFIGNNALEVEDKIISLLENNHLRTQMGNTGKIWLEANRGAVTKSMQAIAELLTEKIPSISNSNK